MKITLTNSKKIITDNIIEIKPTKNKQKTYEIIINSQKNIFFQCKFYSKFIEQIQIKNSNSNVQLKKISENGFLLSSNIEYNNPTIISYIPLDLCSRIYLKEITSINLNTDNLIPITWDNIYVINLEKRPERKKEMIKQFEKNNINQYEFIEAFDGLKPDIISQFNNLTLKENFPIVTSGHYACLLSHIKAIKQAKANNYTNIMILEDDITFCDNFINKINKIMIPKYDMIYLGGISSKKKIFMNSWGKMNRIMGAYAYILNKSLFDYVLEELMKIEDYVDLFYLKKIQPNYHVYILNDYVKTDLKTSDTSHKSKKMIERLNNINKL